jgi:hypothetical protein
LKEIRLLKLVGRALLLPQLIAEPSGPFILMSPIVAGVPAFPDIEIEKFISATFGRVDRFRSRRRAHDRFRH